jgi:uncharacterized protein
MERFAEDATLLDRCVFLKQEATHRAPGARQGEGRRQVPRLLRTRRTAASAPSHRALAIFRGRNEGMLSLR